MIEKPRKRGRPTANPELNADQKKMANELLDDARDRNVLDPSTKKLFDYIDGNS